MLLSWLRRHRRRKLLATSFPAAWLEWIQQNVPHYVLLTEAEQAKLRDAIRVFVAEKNWEGCGGLQLTDEMKVTIAAQACLLILAFDDYYYDRVKTILVYPHGYRAPGEEPGRDGLVHEGGHARSGEAWYRGPVILSWADVRGGGQNPRDGQNLVLHEFAHQLDMLDGTIDGTPPLPENQTKRWREVMSAEYQRLVRDSEHGRATLLDDYGATNEAEFFAVATECFFEKPVQLSKKHAQLYAVLRDFYRQDPVQRHARKAEG